MSWIFVTFGFGGCPNSAGYPSLRPYVYAGGKLLAYYTSAGTDFMLTDWLGTKRAVVGADGQLSSAWCSLPFGNHLQQCGGSGTDPSDIHFTGKERDAETGNDYFGARYYASTMGRFLSPDWSAKVEPVPYAKLDPGAP